MNLLSTGGQGLTVDFQTVVNIATILATILAAVALVFVVKTYRREHPKRRLEYAVRTALIIPVAANVSGLSVKVGEHTVPNPHILEITLVSNSRADIDSGKFDSGKPIRMSIVGSKLVIPTKPSKASQIATTQSAVGPHGKVEVEIAPQLIRPGDIARFSAVTSGPVRVEVEADLIDIPVVEKPAHTFTTQTGVWPKHADIILPSVGAAAVLIFSIVGSIVSGQWL